MSERASLFGEVMRDRSWPAVRHEFGEALDAVPPTWSIAESPRVWWLFTDVNIVVRVVTSPFGDDATVVIDEPGKRPIVQLVHGTGQPLSGLRAAVPWAVERVDAL